MSLDETDSNSRGRDQDNNSEETLLPDAGSHRPTTNNLDRTNKIIVAVLCFINLINYMDRFTLAGILSDVKSYYEIGDDKAGLLQTVFIISYMIFAPIFGYLGDRYSRPKIMAVGIFIWSMTTLLGSFMKDFGWFVFFRAMVGLGEASYSTIAPTIISDLFVKNLRSKMLAIFYFAIPIGSGLGYIVGSETALAMGSWQWGLRVTPVLGLIACVLIVVLVKDPERGEAEGGSHAKVTSYSEDLRSLVKNPSFLLSTFGFTCVAFVAGALAWWGPQFLYLGVKLQSSDPGSVTLNRVGLIFGVITMLAGLIGVPLGMYLGELTIKRYPQSHPIICGLGLIVSAPLFLLAIWLIESYTFTPFVLMFFAQVALNLNWSIVADMLLYVVIPTRRSTAEAFQILISHMFGDAGSPYLVGIISEAVKAYAMTQLAQTTTTSVAEFSVSVENDRLQFRSLQYGLFLTTIVEVIGGIFFLLTSIYIVRDKDKVEKFVSENSIPDPIHRHADDVSQSIA